VLGARDLAYNVGFAWISKVTNPKFRDRTHLPKPEPRLYRIIWPDIGPSDLSNLTRCKQATLEWAAQSAAPRSRKKIRVMGERDIISATALFAFYDEVSH
jgi:hypothetical protein